MADLVPWLIMAGTEAGVETATNVDDNDRGCDDDDDDGTDNDANGCEAAEAVCLDVGWTASKTEH